MSARQLAFARVLQLAPSRESRARRPAPSPGRLPRLTYVICTTPRSGSWLLSESLASTSVAGNPREWFHHQEEQDQRARWRMAHASDLTFAAYLDHVAGRSTTGNGISGIKLHRYQFDELPAKLAQVPRLRGLSGAALMTRAFPDLRYVWLTRADKARQAISLYIASQTGRWWQIEGAEHATRSPHEKDPEYDPVAIRRFERALQEQEASWQAYFSDNRIEPLVVRSEDVFADYRGQVVRVLRWLGVPDAQNVKVPTPRLTRQSNARTEEWLTRYTAFRAEHAEDEAAPGPVPATNLSASMRGGALRNPWRQWIAQQKARRVADAKIAGVLEANGVPRDLAGREVARASEDPYLQAALQQRQRESKAVALLNVLGELRRVDSAAMTIDVRSRPSSAEFRDRYYAANRPVVLRGLMAEWRAPTTWTPEYLKRAVGDIDVEVMTGREANPRYERDAEKHRTSMRFSEYVDKVHSGAVTNDYNLVANNGFFQRFATRELLKDLAPLPPYLRPVKPGEQCFLWFGPAGTLTPLHHDTSNILIAHVGGRKRYRMIPPADWQHVYNETGVFSEVDPEAPDFSRHPSFRRATVLDVVVHPGEMLFMPVGWWHHVRALDVSITISFTHFAYPNHFNWEP